MDYDSMLDELMEEFPGVKDEAEALKTALAEEAPAEDEAPEMEDEELEMEDEDMEDEDEELPFPDDEDEEDFPMMP